MYFSEAGAGSSRNKPECIRQIRRCVIEVYLVRRSFCFVIIYRLVGTLFSVRAALRTKLFSLVAKTKELLERIFYREEKLNWMSFWRVTDN